MERTARSRLGVDLPLYLLKSKDGGYFGGIRFGWRDDEDEFTAGIFVTTDFSLML